MSLIDTYIQTKNNIKKEYGERSVVLFQEGSFYNIHNTEIECREVVILAKIMGIVVTRDNNCGFPVHTLDKFLIRLLHNNYTVAIYDQFDRPNSKLKDRRLVKVYSPSTYISEDITNNWMCCITVSRYHSKQSTIDTSYVYISIIDISTGKNKIMWNCNTRENSNIVDNEIRRVIHSYNPSEIVMVGEVNNRYRYEFGDKLIHYHSQPNKEYYNTEYQTQYMKKVFGEKKYDKMKRQHFLDIDIIGNYITLLDFVYRHDHNIVSRIDIPDIDNSSCGYMYMNEDCIFQLNLVTKGNNRFSSLYDVINNCSTKMGERLLKERILKPITSIETLNARYDMVENVWDRVDEYRSVMRNILDIEKKYRKMCMGYITIKEFVSLYDSFKNIETLFTLDNNPIDKYNLFLLDYMNVFDKDGIKPGYSEKIDGYRNNIQEIEKILNTISDCLLDLGAGRTNVNVNITDSGVYITTTKRFWKSINTDCKINGLVYRGKNLNLSFTDFRVETLKNTVKITCDLMDRLSNNLNINQRNLNKAVISEFNAKIKEYITVYAKMWKQVISRVSEIDIAVNTAYTSKRYGYSRPELVDTEKSFVDIQEIRHPIIERIRDDVEYITNDISLEDKRGMILFGMNWSGKSSMLRSIGCNLVLAQMGFYTSCKKFRYSPYHNCVTKISTTDNLFQGNSTFVTEMIELNNILNRAGMKSMILSDELTAGTETSSSVGIVMSTIKRLISSESTFVFTTHLHEIMKFPQKDYDRIQICHIEIKLVNGNIEFVRKIKAGSGDELYGIEIARTLGLNTEFIRDANHFRDLYLDVNENFLTNKRSRYNKKVIVDHCEMCGEQKNLHTHHIQEQHLADKDNLIGMLPKNIPHNLMVLCDKCHRAIHSD